MKETAQYNSRITGYPTWQYAPDAVKVVFFEAAAGEPHPDEAVWDDDLKAHVWCEADYESVPRTDPPVDTMMQLLHLRRAAVAGERRIGQWFAQVIDLGNRAKDNGDCATANDAFAVALVAQSLIPEALISATDWPPVVRLGYETDDLKGIDIGEAYYDLAVVSTDYALPGSGQDWDEASLCIPVPLLGGQATATIYKAGAGAPRSVNYDEGVARQHAAELEALATWAGIDEGVARQHAAELEALATWAGIDVGAARSAVLAAR